MEKILFVNACIRPEGKSRTMALARAALDKLEGEKQELRLTSLGQKPLDAAGLEKRGADAKSGDFSDPVYDCAKQFAVCDTVVIAAPYWDCCFPSVLKIYVESLCVNKLTFVYGSDGVPKSRCRAKRLIYITTSGGYIGGRNYGFQYIKTVMQLFFGIERFDFFAAEGLDIYGNDPKRIVADAIKKIKTEL